MKTPVEIFDEWLGEIANLKPSEIPFNPRRFHPIPNNIAEPFVIQRKYFERGMEDLRQLFKPNRKIEIYVDFIDDGRCNAAATIYGGWGLVGITKGAIMLPIEMFNRMLSHPGVLREIGNGAIEKIGPQHREGISENYNRLVMKRKSAGRSELPVAPIDEKRQSVAQLCIRIAWAFLVFHEVIHITHGHVDYEKKKRGIPFILEIVQSAAATLSSQNDLDSQAMEFWADMKAVSVSLENLITHGELGAVFPEIEDRIFIWAFAIFTFFRMWGITIDPAKLENAEHPPSAMRFQIIMYLAQEELGKMCPDLKAERFWKIVHTAEASADQGIQLIGGKRLMPEDIIGIHDPRAISHRDTLLDHMHNTLAAELEPLSYVPLKI